MNLVQVIHQRWAAATALNALLPATRLYTGAGYDPVPPLAVVSKQSDKPDSYDVGGSAIDIVVVRMRVLHAQYDAAAAIVHQIKKAFDRTTFALSGSDVVQNMQRTNDFEDQRNDGLWEMTIDFECTVYLAGGA
jgi:hypothetical protein